MEEEEYKILSLTYSEYIKGYETRVKAKRTLFKNQTEEDVFKDVVSDKIIELLKRNEAPYENYCLTDIKDEIFFFENYLFNGEETLSDEDKENSKRMLYHIYGNDIDSASVQSPDESSGENIYLQHYISGTEEFLVIISSSIYVAFVRIIPNGFPFHMFGLPEFCEN